MLLIWFQVKLTAVHHVPSRREGQRFNSGLGPHCVVCLFFLCLHPNCPLQLPGNAASVSVCESQCGWLCVFLLSGVKLALNQGPWVQVTTNVGIYYFCYCGPCSHPGLWSGSAVFPVQAGHGARRPGQPLRGRDHHGQRHGSAGAGGLPPLPLVHVQRPGAEEIHPVSFCLSITIAI